MTIIEIPLNFRNILISLSKKSNLIALQIVFYIFVVKTYNLKNYTIMKDNVRERRLKSARVHAAQFPSSSSSSSS